MNQNCLLITALVIIGMCCLWLIAQRFTDSPGEYPVTYPPSHGTHITIGGDDHWFVNAAGWYRWNAKKRTWLHIEPMSVPTEVSVLALQALSHYETAVEK